MFLLGHSWGGYAVASVLALHSTIRSAACLAPMYNGATMMIEKGEQYVGKLAVTAKPVFNVYQRFLFQDYVEHNSVRGINSVNIPVLVAHGVDDTTITYDKQSIMAHRNEITNPNVQYLTTRGIQGTHDGILFSKEALLYRAEVASDLALIEKQKGEKLTKSELAAYYATINHKLYSQVNLDLMNSIVTMFDKANK
jgi:alpha-beta hydrolase superfamily lysophospholipase